MLASVRERLAEVDPARAEFITAFAGLLARVAYADQEISPAEAQEITRILTERIQLAPAEAAAVTEVVRYHTAVLRGVENYLLTRAFNAVAGAAEKEQLIDCLYAIAAADGLVSNVEDEEVRRIARALLLTHSQVIAIRSRYREQLEVLRSLRRR